MSINKAIVVGHLGKDPEVTKKGSFIIANLSVATSDNYKDKDTGESKQNTEWHRVTLFGKQAEIAEQYLKKGAMVYIEGKLKTEKYTDKNNIERYVTKIIGNQLQMLTGKEKTNYEDNQSNNNDLFNDNIPF